MNTRAIKAILGATLLVAGSGVALAQELSPYLSPRAGDATDLGNGVALQVSEEQLALPGHPRFFSAATAWSPIDGIILNAGVETAANPCPAPLDGECEWQPASEPLRQRSFSVGASWRPLQSLSLSVDYRNAPLGHYPVYLSGDGLGVFIDSEDLSLSCELDTESWGNLELGLQVSRWAEALGEPLVSPDPYTSAALDLGWRWGAFRGGVTGRSTQIGTEPSGPWNTVDLDFAWRTPWNASLSVGARNVLDQPAPNAAAIDEPGMDDFLGRVPYVRYQQDL